MPSLKIGAAPLIKLLMPLIATRSLTGLTNTTKGWSDVRKEANSSVNGLIETGELACRKTSALLQMRTRQVLVLFSALCGFAFSINCIALPSVKIGTAPLIDTSTAEAGYPTSLDTVHTNTLTGAPTPNEIIELARALGNSPDNIYDFVANYVDTVFMFGAQKGAIGAIIDKSGTPFDQAELMVALLRQAGFTASYQFGTRSLSAAQFQAWTNITNAQAACNLLASGGIPGSINGSASTVACSSFGTTGVSNVTLEHVWVDVVISGTHYAFDPSYKTYNFTAPVNLSAAAGLTSGDPMNAAAGNSSGLATGSLAPPGDPGSPINYVANLNATALDSRLSTYAGNLQNYIQTQSSVAGVPLASGKIIDLVGGREIHQVNVSGTRTPTLSAATVKRTWSSIPDQFRSSIAITLTKQNSAGTVDTTINNLVLFADDIYGRKLIYDTNFVTKGTAPFVGSLEVVDEFQRIIQKLSTYTSADNSNFSVGTITISANHPYLANAGTYMDTIVQFPVRYSTPFTIVHGWGEANRGLIDKWASRPDGAISGFMPPFGCDTCLTGHPASKGDAKREQLAALWLVQSSKAARLHAFIANSIYTHHHSIGLIAGDAEMATLNRNPTVQPEVLEWDVADNFDRVDIETGLSVTSLTSNVMDRRVAIQSIAATMDLLEGSVSAQQSDLPDTVSTATRFEWGNSPPTGEDPSGSSGTGVGPRRFLDLNATPVAALTSPLILVEGVSSSSNTGVHGAATPTIGNLETSSRQQAMVSFLSSYLNGGFRVIASQEGFLGPGQRAGSFIASPPGAQYTHRYTHQRGGAFVAMKVDANGDPLEIAHVSVNVNQDGSVFYGIKGGGGGTQPDQQSNYDPSMAADILKGQFVDRSEVLGVDLQTGGITYDSPAKLTVGNGDFPYSLSANMTWRGGVEQDETFSEQSHVAPNTPWTTNWNNGLTISGSALEAMGETDIRASAGTVATFLAMQDVYRSPYTAQREVAAVLVGSWWAHQITGNVASVNVGTATKQFLRKSDATWFAPGPKGFATLTQTGQRQIYTQFSCVSGALSYVTTRGWDYSSVGYVVTNANGDQQLFQFWQNGYTDSVAYCAWLHGFRMSSWTFPYGMTINFTYQPNGFMVDELTEVKNSLGRKIHFTTSGYGGFDNELTGADFRSVSITDAPAGDFPTSSTQIDPAGTTTTINFSLTGFRYLLTNVFTADNTASPALAYTYDSLNRAETAKDAVALRTGTRGPYQFFIGEGARADRIDPAGGNYTVVYDIYRRAMQYYDELGRETTVSYDGRGRVTSYTYPELNQQVFAYDDHNNTTSLTRIAKPGSPLTFPAIQAVWNQTWNKPSSITDALGCLTTFNYYPSGSGTSLLQNATRCKPDSTQANPVYSFTYNSLGQKLTATDPTSLIVSNSYDTATNGGNLLTTTLDPTTADPSGINAVTSYAYDSNGNNTSVTDPRLNVTEYQYDADRRKTVTLHHNGGLTACLIAAEKTIYDVLGRSQEQDGATVFSSCTTVMTWQALKTTTYTDNSKVLTEKDGAGDTTTYGYDPMDRTALVTDPVNRRVGTVYDLAGQTLCTWRGWDSTTVPSTCSGWVPTSYNGTGKFLYGVYAYSPNGKQTSITDANNNLTGMTYDGVDRLVTLSFPLPTIGSLSASTTDYESYTYDANDNRKSVRKRDGQVISYNFDSLNRQVTKILPATTTADIWSTYDLAGRPLTDFFGSSTAPTASGVAYGYDSAKRMASETQFGRTMAYQNDKAGNRIQTTWPDTNFINYDFDALNREYQIRENGATTGAGVLGIYAYDSLSRRMSLTRGNGTSTSYGYDLASRMNSLGHNVAGTAQDIGITFGYTLASQLQTRGSNNALYDWLPAAASTAYVPNGLNRYLTVGGVSYGYDTRGNMTSDGTNTYSYDVENRLLTASGPTAVTFGYDPLGRLQSTTVGSTPTQYLYSGTELVAELNGSGTVLRRYVHGPGTDDPVVWYEGSTLATRNYLHADERGSVIATTDNTGTATVYTYGPYGEPNPSWTGSRFRYTGQTAIPEAHLYYYKARVYSPTLGRFLQTDPIGTKDDLNLYTYVNDDPIDGLDPTGQDTYIINRDLEALGFGNNKDQPRWNPLTHTFVAITSPSGSVEHVYSWGNSSNLKGWSTDQKLDVHAAQLAVQDGRAEKVGDKELDPFVTKAVGLLDKKENEHRNGIVCNNCKAEAGKLVDGAKGLQALATMTAAQKGYDSIKINTSGDTVTATGTYTPIGSRISRSITCDSEGHCK